MSLSEKIGLLKEFKNIIIRSNEEKIELRSNLQSLDDINLWIQEYSAVTNTQWIMRSSIPNGKYMTCSKKFVCHHSGFKKVKSHLNKKGLSKNKECQAVICIKIKKESPMTKRDPYVKNGLRAVIKVFNKHSHALETAEACRFLTSTVKSEFYNYFFDGICATESLRHHSNILKKKGIADEDLANARINPTLRTVKYWFDLWKTENLGPRCGAGVFKKITERKPFYQEKGIIVECIENPLSILVVTPLMKRAHHLPSAKEVVFVDFTTQNDNETYSVTCLLTPCSAGVAPLAILITEDLSTENFTNALFLIKSTVSDAFGGVGYPKVFLTSYSISVMDALNEVWPESNYLFSRFYVLQTVWNWLWKSRNNILMEDRSDLMNRFNYVLCSNRETVDQCLVSALDGKYPQWNKYIADTFYCIKERWILAYMDQITKYHQTNCFSEIGIRIFKENISNRIRKPYNVISLINVACFTLNRYFIEKFCSFTNNSNSSSRFYMHNLFGKTTYLTKDNITMKEENIVFLVPSESGNIQYTVNCEVGLCSCPDGTLGKFCQHLCSVHKFFNIMPENFPLISRKQVYEVAVLALGDKTPIEEFVPSDHEDCDQNQVNENSQSSVEIRATNQVNCKISKKIEQEFHEIESVMKEKLDNFSVGATTLVALRTFKNRLLKINSNRTLETFLYTSGKNHKQITFPRCRSMNRESKCRLYGRLSIRDEGNINKNKGKRHSLSHRNDS